MLYYMNKHAIVTVVMFVVVLVARLYHIICVSHSGSGGCNSCSSGFTSCRLNSTNLLSTA